MSDAIKILVVDDEDSIRESLVDLLRIKGFDVQAAENGTAALEMIEAWIPDLILADIMMPQMNGYQFYQRVRANPNWIWIPFIFLTAKGEAEDIRFAKELGVDDYLRKPIDVEDLIAAVYGRLKRFSDLQEGVSLGVEIESRVADDLDRIANRFSLTRREADVLKALIAGKSNADIAIELVVGIATIKSHVSNILGKLGARSRAEVVSIVLQSGQDTHE